MLDNVKPEGKWVFNGEVAACFDDMLRRSIPLYETMREAVLNLAERYIRPDTWVLDLGCSRGEAMAPLVERFHLRNRFMGIEISDPMLDEARLRFAEYERFGLVQLKKMDLRTEFPDVLSSVTLSILTLQFIPIEWRQAVIRNVFNGLLPGGAFIVVEKVLGETAELNAMMVNFYLALKRASGYTEEQINLKRLALEGVLVSATPNWNEDLLNSAGFRQVGCFWRWMNFAGWIAIK